MILFFMWMTSDERITQAQAQTATTLDKAVVRLAKGRHSLLRTEEAIERAKRNVEASMAVLIDEPPIKAG
jgi:hypothetical protein